MGAVPGTIPGIGSSAAVREAVEAGVDPELSLRAAADRYREQVEENG